MTGCQQHFSCEGKVPICGSVVVQLRLPYHTLPSIDKSTHIIATVPEAEPFQLAQHKDIVQNRFISQTGARHQKRHFGACSKPSGMSMQELYAHGSYRIIPRFKRETMGLSKKFASRTGKFLHCLVLCFCLAVKRLYIWYTKVCELLTEHFASELSVVSMCREFMFMSTHTPVPLYTEMPLRFHAFCFHKRYIADELPVLRLLS